MPRARSPADLRGAASSRTRDSAGEPPAPPAGSAPSEPVAGPIVVPARPEIEAILLACALARPDSATVDRFRARLAHGVDPALLLEAATRHGVVPLLHTRIAEFGGDRVPGDLARALREARAAVARRNFYLASQLLTVLAALERGGIEAVAFKGPPLAAAVYGGLDRREFCDLDLLVRPRDVERATETLLAAGFELEGPPEEELPPAAHVARTLRRPRDRVAVDLHWGFTRLPWWLRSRIAHRRLSLSIEAEAVWGETREVALLGRRVRTFGFESLLVLLCVHGGKSGPSPWPKLKWTCDIAELVRRRPELDWERAVATAERLGCRRMLYLGLSLAAALFRTPPPYRVWREVAADRRVEELRGAVVARLAEALPPPPFRSSARLYLDLHERARDRATYGLALLLYPSRRDGSWTRPGLPLPARLPARLARLAARAIGAWPGRGA